MSGTAAGTGGYGGAEVRIAPAAPWLSNRCAGGGPPCGISSAPMAVHLRMRACGRGRPVRRGTVGRHGRRGAVGCRDFVRRYQRRIFGLAYSMTGDAGVAEDVAQEAMIRVWRHAPVFDPRRGSVASWVLTITRNLAIDALRLRRAVPTDPDDFAALRPPEQRAQPRGHGAPGRRPRHRAGGARVAPRRAAAGRRAGSRLRQDRPGDQRGRGHPLGTAKTRIRTALIRLRAAVEHAEGVSDER